MLKGGIEQTHFQGYVFRVLQIFRDVARWSMSPCPTKLWCRCVPPFTQRCCPGWFRWMPKMICWIFTPGIRKRMCQKWAFWCMVPIGSLGFVGSNFDPFQNSPRSPVWRGWKDSPFACGQLCWFCSRPECQTTRVRSPHLPDVLITGHSLGGGVAALLAALWRVSWLFLRSLWLAGSLEVSLLSRKFSLTPSDFVDILDRKGMEGLIANMSKIICPMFCRRMLMRPHCRSVGSKFWLNWGFLLKWCDHSNWLKLVWSIQSIPSKLSQAYLVNHLQASNFPQFPQLHMELYSLSYCKCRFKRITDSEEMAISLDYWR